MEITLKVEGKEKKYTINHKGCVFELTDPTMNNLLVLYCDVGGGLTSTELAKRLGIDADVIKNIVRSFKVNKSMSLVDLFTAKNEFDNSFEENNESLESTINKLFSRNLELEEKVRLLESKDSVSSLLGDFSVNLPEWVKDEYLIWSRANKKQVEGEKSVVIAISDLHVGLIVREEETITGNGYNAKVFRDRFDQITGDILSSYHIFEGADNIYVCLMGDLFEGVLGNMREGHMREVELYGMDQINLAVSYIAKFIRALSELYTNKNIKVKYVSGNHDRINESKQNDQTRIFMQFAFKLLESALSGVKNVELQDIHAKRWYGIQVTDNCRLIIQHGDMNCKVDEMFKIDSINHALYRIFLKGHYHTKKVLEGNMFTEITTTSLVGGSFYSENNLALTGIPSQLVLEITDNIKNKFPVQIKTHWFDAKN